MRAIEIFQDLNAEDMDVTAPPSSREYFKEVQVADVLNDCLNQMIEGGMFDDCDYRDVPTTSDDESCESEISERESEGFDYEGESNDGASGVSFTDRFKRYVKRIMPKSMRRADNPDTEEEDSGRGEDGDKGEELSSGSSLDAKKCDD